MASPYALPSFTIHNALAAMRALLLDPALGPQVPTPGVSNARLQEVRIVGAGSVDGDTSTGTMNWTPGNAGWPFAFLDARNPKKDARRETGRVWEDWTGFLIIGLTQQDNGTVDITGWANDWDAVVTQMTIAHRRFGLPIVVDGDGFWEHVESNGPRNIVFNGVVFAGLVCRLNVHLVVRAPWGV